MCQNSLKHWFANNRHSFDQHKYGIHNSVQIKMGNFCCGGLKSEIIEETKEEVRNEIEEFKKPLYTKYANHLSETRGTIRTTCEDYDQDSVQSRFRQENI